MLADDFMLRDGYPRLYSSEMPLELFFSSYLSTYVERNVAGYLNMRNVTAFHKFLRLCALSGALWRLAWNQVSSQRRAGIFRRRLADALKRLPQH